MTIPGNDADVLYQHAAPQNGRGLNDPAVGHSVAEAQCFHVHAQQVKMVHKRLTYMAAHVTYSKSSLKVSVDGDIRGLDGIRKLSHAYKARNSAHEAGDQLARHGARSWRQ